MSSPSPTTSSRSSRSWDAICRSTRSTPCGCSIATRRPPRTRSEAGEAMLITRTPLRISLGGGGTDLPSYYRRFGGVVISAAISKYVYVGINRTFTEDYFLKYSELERVRSVPEIRHSIIREALTLHEVGPSVEIVSLADIPGGTGLGSSATLPGLLLPP